MQYIQASKDAFRADRIDELAMHELTPCRMLRCERDKLKTIYLRYQKPWVNMLDKVDNDINYTNLIRSAQILSD